MNFKQTVGLLSLSLGFGGVAAQESHQPLNVLLITADDLNCNSVGAFGGKVDDITPNIDKLASEGIRFSNAHVTVAVCQPSRGALATGRYPYRSGITGFYHTDKEIPTIVRTLKKQNYFCGILGKTGHSSPKVDTPWDFYLDRQGLGMGRDKDLYYQEVRAVIQKAKEDNKPFYLMANSHDPHRPYSRSLQEKRAMKNIEIKDPSRIYGTKEVKVPGFLPDIPQVRLEISEYYGSVKRLDDTVGKILQALKDENVDENTLVMFLSDNGMALPFAKTNCYLNSTRTPWIVRWPGKVKPGKVDRHHFISGVDFFPTVLDAIGIDVPEGLDGESFVPLLKGEKQEGRAKVFTQFYETAGAQAYPMRCIQDKRYGYIFNAWSNNEKVFRNESQSGRSFSAMKKAGKENPDIAARVQLFQYRVVEEFYDLKKDPDALHNLINDAKYQRLITQKRRELQEVMEKTQDPVLPAFLNWDNPKEMAKVVAQLQKEAKIRKKSAKKGVFEIAH